MSERGTFVTSYLYDYANIVPVLRAALPKICRKWEGSMLELRPPGNDSEEKTRAFMGVMHGGYMGEEAFEMEQFIEDEIIPGLPAEHGEFSISVLPDSERYAAVFTIHNRKVKRYKVGSPEPVI